MRTFSTPSQALLKPGLFSRNRRLTRAAFFLAGAASALGTAQAHDMHGLVGSHWHATDVLGFVVAGGVLAVAIWLSRGGK